MNKSRRKKIAQVIDSLDKIKDLKSNDEALELLRNSMKNLEYIADDEEIAMDSLPENMQWSQRGYDFQDNLDNLNDAQIDLDSAIEKYENADEPLPYKLVRKYIKSAIQNCTEAIER